MSRTQSGILVLCSALLIVMLMFPPYFAMDVTSDGEVHGFLGYHPTWNAPSQVLAHAILSEGGVLPESGVQPADLSVRKNWVRLTVNALILVVLSLTSFSVLRIRKTRGSQGEETVHRPD